MSRTTNMHSLGKKKSNYTATAPDGRELKKSSFNFHTENAFIAAYNHNDKWIVTGVTDSVHDWGSQIFIKAKKQ